MMIRKVSLLICLTLISYLIKAQNYFDPISKSYTNLTQINSDYGPRNVSVGSTFHKGIDFQLSAFNKAYSIKDGSVSKIRFLPNDNINYIIVSDNWRYMHFPDENNNYTWEVIDSYSDEGTCDLIVIRELINGDLNTIKVLGSNQCSINEYYDPRTDTNHTIKKTVNEGEYIYISKSGSLGNHLHLDRGQVNSNIPIIDNPLTNIAHSSSNDPQIDIIQFQKLINDNLLQNIQLGYGDVILLSKFTETTDKDLNRFLYKFEDTVLMEWFYSGSNLISNNEVFVLSSESSIINSSSLGVFPFGSIASVDYAKYEFSSLLIPDGIQTVTIIAEDILEDSDVEEVDFLFDNFLPYIKKVTLSDSEGLFYEGEWTLNNSETALIFNSCTYRDEITDGFEIEVETSETLNNLSMSILNVNDFPLTFLNTEKTLWGASLMVNIPNNNEHNITFSGTDTAENSLLILSLIHI